MASAAAAGSDPDFLDVVHIHRGVADGISESGARAVGRNTEHVAGGVAVGTRGVYAGLTLDRVVVVAEVPVEEVVARAQLGKVVAIAADDVVVAGAADDMVVV